MIGLARMAANLADARTRLVRPDHLGIAWDVTSDPTSREYASRFPGSAPASAEYYRIIDRITRGERP